MNTCTMVRDVRVACILLEGPFSCMCCCLPSIKRKLLHTHAGYYPKGGSTKSNQEAQIDMIDESLRWANISEATAVSFCSLALQHDNASLLDYSCMYPARVIENVQAARMTAQAA